MSQIFLPEFSADGERDGLPEAQSGTSPADGDKKEKGDSGVDSRENRSYKKLSKLKVLKNNF